MLTPRLILTACVVLELVVFGWFVRREEVVPSVAPAPYGRVSMVLASPVKPVSEPVVAVVSQAPPSPTFSDLCPKPPPAKFDALLGAAAEEFGVDPRVLATTVYRESACDKDALGSSGEIGLGQVLPKVWVPVLVEAEVIRRAKDLWHPKTNLRASAFILATLHEQADGNLLETFRRYNGSGRKARTYAREQVRAFASLWGSGAGHAP